MTAYAFTNDWMNSHEQDWREVLASFAGAPRVHFAEVGSYEGRSACWFVDNILTGAGSMMTCFDPWEPYADRPGDDMQAVEARFDANAAACSRPEAIRKYIGDSFTLATRRPPDGFDMIYIDGDHSASAVLADAVLAWRALKIGGLLMFDDLAWRPENGGDDRPGKAIEAFMGVMAIGGRSKVERETRSLMVLRRLK